MKKNKLLLIGWDAADWKIIGPLLAKGQMPALKSLIDRGVYGNMSTMNPPYSPMLWSSVATGKTPDKHGVLGFVEVMPDLKGVRPVTVNSRKSRAIWNILHHKGMKSNLVGWWPSYPAEPINGVVVTDKFQNVSADPKKKSPLLESAIHPESMRDDFINLRMFPYELTQEHILPFIQKAGEIDQEKDKGLKAFSKIMSQNVSVHNAATKLLRTTEWDFMAVYYDLIDHFCHSFMKYYPPRLKQIPENIYEIYKDAVDGSYRFQDMMLDRKLQLIDEDTTVIVMSDHGFESGPKRILDMPKVQAAPALEHRQFGMFVAAGPNIKKNEKIFGLGLIDIAPTILHHFNLPIGEDMDGKIALDIFKKQGIPKYINSWEKVEGDFGENKNKNQVQELSDQETMDQLIELGYIERPDEKIEIAILKTRCDLKHNLARVYLGKKDYENARKILIELLEEEDPIDIAPFYMDLISISIRTNKLNDAQEFLNKLKKLNTKVRYNLFFHEADILVGQGKHKKALTILEPIAAQRNNAEIWFRIGKIRFGLGKFEEAKVAFEMAIHIESDRAKYHRGIAECYFELKDYEEATDHALTSIELVKYFPEAHYILGRSLEKMGDLKNAKIAFETASKLKPVEHHRANISIENIEEKLKAPIELEDKSEFKYRKDQIVIVSGLPRSGTSLMMQMLDKGGVEILMDEKRKADESNPKGYYEYEPVMSIHKDNSWLDNSMNKATKVVAPLLKYLNLKYRYKIIFMKRDLHEVVRSQQKMIGKNPDTLPIQLFNSYQKQLESIEIWKNKEPGIELIYIDYNELVNNPKEQIDKIVSFVGSELDENKMIHCIDKKLYRNKIENIKG